MAAIADLVLANHAAANVTYKVRKETDGVGYWYDGSQGTAQGERTVSMGLFLSKDPSKGVNRVRCNIARPVVNGTTGLVDYTSRANVECIIPVLATLAERQELYAMLKNGIAHAVFGSMVKDAETVW